MKKKPLPRTDAQISVPRPGAKAEGEVLETQHYYRMRDFAPRILRMIELFEPLERTLRRERKRAWLLWLFALVSTYLLLRFDRVLMPNVAGQDGLVVAVGVFTYLLVFTLFKMISSKRHVNPSSFARKSAWKFIPVLVVGLFVLFNLSSQAGAVLSEIRTLPNLFVSPLSALYLVATMSAAVATLALFFSARRYGKIIPQTFEVAFCREILSQLLREVPPDLKCSVIWNPFPAAWSQESRAASRGAREATFDCLLKADLPLGADRFLSLVVMHRITQKGRRKFKGYKHKLKIAYSMSDPALKQPDSNTIQNNFLRLVKENSEEITRKDNALKFSTKNDFSSMFECKAVPGKLGMAESFVTVKSFSPELDAKDLLHPSLILWRIKALTEVSSDPKLHT